MRRTCGHVGGEIVVSASLDGERYEPAMLLMLGPLIWKQIDSSMCAARTQMLSDVVRWEVGSIQGARNIIRDLKACQWTLV